MIAEVTQFLKDYEWFERNLTHNFHSVIHSIYITWVYIAPILLICNINLHILLVLHIKILQELLTCILLEYDIPTFETVI